MKRLIFICEQFKERSEALGLKGIKRENSALDYFIGACTLLEKFEPQEAKELATWIGLILVPRGFKAIEQELLEKAQEPSIK